MTFQLSLHSDQELGPECGIIFLVADKSHRLGPIDNARMLFMQILSASRERQMALSTMKCVSRSV